MHYSCPMNNARGAGLKKKKRVEHQTREFLVGSKCYLYGLTSPYRKNILKTNLSTARSISSFTPFYRCIVGKQISGSLMGQFQMTITLLIYVEKIQNLCSNSSLGCLLSKRFKPRLRIPSCLLAFLPCRCM